MSHKYTNYSNPKTQTKEKEAVVPAIEPEVEDIAVEEPETADVAEEVVDTPVVAEVFGMVVDTKKLRVRKSPNTTAEVVCVIEEGSKVTIDLDQSTVGFYKVCTEAGVEGYCVKQYIAVV